MATITLFDALPNDLWDGIHNVTSHTFKAAFLTSAASPAASDATPTWGDYSANETSGGNVPAGGVTLDNFTATDTAVDFDDEVIAADGSNPADARYMVIYNDTATSDNAIGFVNFGSDQDLTPGATIVPASGGFITQSA